MVRRRHLALVHRWPVQVGRTASFVRTHGGRRKSPRQGMRARLTVWRSCAANVERCAAAAVLPARRRTRNTVAQCVPNANDASLGLTERPPPPENLSGKAREIGARKTSSAARARESLGLSPSIGAADLPAPPPPPPPAAAPPRDQDVAQAFVRRDHGAAGGTQLCGGPERAMRLRWTHRARRYAHVIDGTGPAPRATPALCGEDAEAQAGCGRAHGRLRVGLRTCRSRE